MTVRSMAVPVTTFCSAARASIHCSAVRAMTSTFPRATSALVNGMGDIIGDDSQGNNRFIFSGTLEQFTLAAGSTFGDVRLVLDANPAITIRAGLGGNAGSFVFADD